MNHKVISTGPIELSLPVKPPFIVTAHHLDLYPKGNANMEPPFYFEDRDIGQDFNLSVPWRMYHGDKIPGFPRHPHRGFETITVVEQGFVDHTDSDGGTGRYGEGDVQWMTAGSGIQHCEMFPLVYQDRENTMELFQIWLNLPSKNKLVKPHYKMLWHEDIPIVKEKDVHGNITAVKVIAGNLKDTAPLAPAPDSWATDPENHVTIWLLDMEPHAEFLLRSTSPTASRMLYYYRGENMMVEDVQVPENYYIELVSDEEILLKNGATQSKLLLLEGEPINEPVAAYGPFVMNTEQEIMQAYEDYHETQFGGWSWSQSDPINPSDAGRFATHSDGTVEYPKIK